MKTYMPLDGFRWSCDSDSALCDMRQTNVLGRAGGGRGFIVIFAKQDSVLSPHMIFRDNLSPSDGDYALTLRT